MNYELRTTNYELKEGFTLLEILVVVVIFGILGVSVTASLYSLIRGANKAERIKEIKQNGDYVMGVIERRLRNALDITSSCASGGTDSNTITLTNADNATRTIYSCVVSSGVRRIEERVEDINTGTVTSTNFLTNTSVTVSDDCTTGNILFRCTQDAITGSKNISVTLNLDQNETVTAAESVTETFQVQVSLRN